MQMEPCLKVMLLENSKSPGCKLLGIEKLWQISGRALFCELRGRCAGVRGGRD